MHVYLLTCLFDDDENNDNNAAAANGDDDGDNHDYDFFKVGFALSPQLK